MYSQSVLPVPTVPFIPAHLGSLEIPSSNTNQLVQLHGQSLGNLNDSYMLLAVGIDQLVIMTV